MSAPNPQNKASLANEEMLLALKQALTKKRVLIVDRHSPARDSLQIMLSGLGVTAVHGAGNSAEVIRQVRNNRFDIILSDFVLDDGRDGQQLLEELRYSQLIPLATVYMIITSERAYTNVMALAELAPDDYLIKPFTGEQLQARLIRAIYKKHMLRQVYENLERGALQSALDACEQVLKNYPALTPEALRFKGELLISLARHGEAEALYRDILAERDTPWAKIGLAMAVRERGALEESESLALQLIAEHPDFLSAYDFLAAVREQQGRLPEAQQALQMAADVSPHNIVRQRLVGDIALRNKDLLAAEKAYGKVLQRSHGSSLRTVDDFANLSRVQIDRGNIEGARRQIAELQRNFRGDKQAELAALIAESLCLEKEGTPKKAAALVDKAIVLQHEVRKESREKAKSLSPRLQVDLAHACFSAGQGEIAHQLMRQAAVENHDDAHLLQQIGVVYEKTGQAEAGQALLDAVNQEIVELNNRGVIAARSGDLEGSVQLLIQAAEQVPNLQFLTNAAKAIFTLLDQKGWDAELAARGQAYLQQAMRKDRKNSKVASARELLLNVARKYGAS